MDAAASKSRKYLAITFPREAWWVKLGFAMANGFMVATRCSFRGFVHPVAEIEAVATNAGFVVRHTDNDLVWQALVLERVA